MAPAADGGLGSPGAHPGGSIAESWKAEARMGATRVAGSEPKKRGSAGESGSGEFAQVSGMVHRTLWTCCSLASGGARREPALRQTSK